jgi:hypothetical protein
MKTLIVVGDFNDQGGRESKFGGEFAREYVRWVRLHPPVENTNDCEIHNGGSFEELTNIDFTEFNTIIWFANIPNDKPKLVRNIKEVNRKCMLVTSKRNDLGKYSLTQLLGRALQTKSNLLVEFKVGSTFGSLNVTAIVATVYDPLGNCFIETTQSVPSLVSALSCRLRELREFTRVGSHQLGEAVPFPTDECGAEFFNPVRRYADTFHALISAPTERFLGNVSFRCTHGFPSFRSNTAVFVSKRNIDKRGIDENGFVAVRETPQGIGYYGLDKPSVDTPIQLALYATYHKINFMLHSHTYVQNAPFTSKIIPCGAVEEVDEIRSLIPSSDCNWFFVNLLGHGSICAVEDPSMWRNIPYIARPMPELYNGE